MAKTKYLIRFFLFTKNYSLKTEIVHFLATVQLEFDDFDHFMTTKTHAWQQLETQNPEFKKQSYLFRSSKTIIIKLRNNHT